MKNTLLEDFKFSPKEQAVTMDSFMITFKEGKVTVPNAYLLFQWLLLATLFGKNDSLTIENELKHELCPFAPALFDSVDLLKMANKSDLANHIQDLVTNCNSATDTISFDSDVHYVIQKIKWQKPSVSFLSICKENFRYLQYISPDKNLQFFSMVRKIAQQRTLFTAAVEKYNSFLSNNETE